MVEQLSEILMNMNFVIFIKSWIQAGSKELPVVSDGDGIHGISFMPLSEGLYSIEVWYGGEKVRTRFGSVNWISTIYVISLKHY